MAKAKKTSTAVKKKTVTKSAKSSKVSAKKDAAKSLDDLFEDTLKDAYWAENAVKDALPKMIKNASSEKLKKALKDHLEETKGQITQLKAVFKTIDVKPEGEKCDAMAGILEEGEGILKATKAGAVRDAGIISACQKVEHYEIASYGTMIAYTQILKNKEAKKILSDVLTQERKADKLLSKLAVSEINIKADK